jgi:hypothetical protein
MAKRKLPEDIGKRFNLICCLFSPGPSLKQSERERMMSYIVELIQMFGKTSIQITVEAA